MNKSSQPPSSPASSISSSKLPKFLRTNSSSTRDRAKSIADSSTSSLASTSSEGSSKPRKSRFLPRRSADVSSPSPVEEPPAVISPPDTEPPIIVEPVTIPRLRRALSPTPPSSPSTSPPRISLYASTPGTSTSRLTDLPTRLSGWFSHTFSTSTTDLSLPSLLASTSSTSSQSYFTNSTSNVSPGTSPKRSVGANALLTAAKHGKGHLDKAMRYLLDSDAMPDKCTDPIWILGVKHPGWEPPPPSNTLATTASLSPSLSSSTKSMRSPVSSVSDATQGQGGGGKAGGIQWPPVFYADFTSRIWLTYRSHFTPIRDVRLGDLDGVDAANKEKEEGSSSPVIGRRPWTWGGGGASAEKGWTSDSGWGCMLRTGQSLLANALVHLHLGRDWRRPPHPIPTADYAMYVQILTWFLDTPAPEAPFSVHRMALAGKELGKDVGQWFGPSTAAGAIKTLVNVFPDAGLGVVVATDGVLFQSEVFRTSWGDRPVLLLIGVRLGLDGVNPIYYETIKMLYTFPQSVGIAGGRPSSSYYFVGSQADNLFYLDPHHARPAEHYVTAYPVAELKTYHCERIRKMPLSGLDPSMLIGFVCRDESDWEDFRRRVGELPKTVFSVQEEPPSWPSDVDDNMGLESFSEPDPDDFLLDMDHEEKQDEDEDEDEDEERDEYFDTRSPSASTSTSSASASQSGSASGHGGKRARGTSEDVDTEEDSVDPVTPLPNARFTIVPPPPPPKMRDDDDGEEIKQEMFDDDHDDDDIEDDWVDPSVPTPISSVSSSMHVSPPAAPAAPTHVRAHTSPKMHNKTSRKGRKEVPVPVPLVKVPTPSSLHRSSSHGQSQQQQQQQEHYPFPVTDEVSPPRPEHRLRHTSKGMMGGKRMHTARARDGGRTQSGGVKGILTGD
ncbi:Cysteine protease ATG4 [Termitomyces sp. J132]|nr:Cysteine protease ATG4 [Termitomyces sp. J132]